jgi:hypothetical protein
MIARPSRADVTERWSRLSPWQRRLIAVAAAVETALKGAMLLDLRQRPADQVRGPKWLWAASALVNSAGILPASYFVLGRRDDPPSP